LFARAGRGGLRSKSQCLGLARPKLATVAFLAERHVEPHPHPLTYGPASNAHLQPNGEYHYHGMPHGLINTLGGIATVRRRMTLIGWAADGHPIYYPYGPTDPWNLNSAHGPI
jgi:hypothetical protein